MPYLWQCFELASEKHVPIIRPTFFNFPDDLNCFNDCDDFMLGNDLLVAPVVEKGVTQRQIYLPKLATGEHWFDFYSRQKFQAGQIHCVECASVTFALICKVRRQDPSSAGATWPLTQI
jgi:alpha-glucosidase